MPWLGLALILLLSWWLRSRYLWVMPFDYDEGHWLMFGVLVNAGYPAYTTTFVGIPPLALLVIQLGARLFDTTLAARYPMMLFSLLGIGGIFLALQPWKSRKYLLAGLLAASFLSFNQLYFQNSASIMAEVPAVALAILSLAMARQYYITGSLLWLVLSGSVFALSLALKVFVVFLPLLIGLLILEPTLAKRPIRAEMNKVIMAGIVWIAGFLLTLAGFMVMYDLPAMYQQVFLFRLELRQVWAQQIALSDNVWMVAQIWLGLTPLIVGAIVGAVLGWQRNQIDVIVWLGWWAFSTLLLIWHIPLRDRYAVMLVPALAVLSGVGVAKIAVWIFYRLKSRYTRQLGAAATILFLLVVFGLALVTPVKSVVLPHSPDTFPDLNLAAVKYVWENTLPNDCIITDDQRFAFAANRLVPARLSETSWARIITGWLTVDDIVHQVDDHNCPMVVYTDRRFELHLPTLQTEVRKLYFLEIAFDDNLVVYTGNKHFTHRPASPLEAQLGQSIALTGIDLVPPPPWAPGQEVRLATYWIGLTRPNQAYKIFLHLRNDANETVASFDHFPFPAPNGEYRVVPNIENYQDYSPEEIASYPARGMLPTNAWPINQTIREVTFLALPADLPAGVYNLYIGLYNPDTQARLVAYDKSTGAENNALWLASIEILN